MSEPVVRVAVGSWSLGAILAFLVLVAALVLWLVGKLPPLEAGLLAGLALARLL